MTLPYTCIEAFRVADSGNTECVLVGASGSRLVVQSSSGPSLIWPEVQEAPTDEVQDEGPPGKRIKLSPPTQHTSNFSCLRFTSDKKHLVAVTAEDKAIRVFSIDAEHKLRQLSERCMTRRPCAIALTADNSTILCADKFGDVYSLPLIPGPEDEQKETPISEPTESETPFVPAASVLTVHSGRNRKVLEEQLKQATKGPKKPKEGPSFKHELLLGHVSMLTDIAYATVDGRSYIITADRDEHIRVSRGPPQAHIIEGFCFGHEAFVSRLCLTGHNLLVSGGGDPYLLVWNWSEYRVVEKLQIRDAVLEHLKSESHLASTLPEQEENFKIAVSGIWSVPHDQSDKDEILVACEGIPALFSFRLGGSDSGSQTMTLSGNALDVTFIHGIFGKLAALVSVDNVHVPGSTRERRKDESSARLQYLLHQEDGTWIDETPPADPFQWFGQNAGKDSKTSADGKALRDVLYGIENLRKRPGSED